MILEAIDVIRNQLRTPRSRVAVLKCTTEVAREHLQLDSNHSRAVYFSCRTSPTREPIFTEIFLSHEEMHAFFINLGVVVYIFRTGPRTEGIKIGLPDRTRYLTDSRCEQIHNIIATQSFSRCASTGSESRMDALVPPVRVKLSLN